MMNILFLRGRFSLCMLDSYWTKCSSGFIISNAKVHWISTFWLNNNKTLHFDVRKGFPYTYTFILVFCEVRKWYNSHLILQKDFISNKWQKIELEKWRLIFNFFYFHHFAKGCRSMWHLSELCFRSCCQSIFSQLRICIFLIYSILF